MICNGCLQEVSELIESVFGKKIVMLCGDCVQKYNEMDKYTRREWIREILRNRNEQRENY